MNATGKALDWLAGDVLGSATTTEALVAEALAVAPGADGLVFLPYLAGERSPIWDPVARGAFVGLTLRHDRAHLVRAVLEAADLALRHVAAPILAAGIRVDELRVSGGRRRVAVARSAQGRRDRLHGRGPGGRRDRAGRLGDRRRRPGSAPSRTSPRGSGRWFGSTIGSEPDPALRPVYDALYATYVDLYPALRSTFHRLALADG